MSSCRATNANARRADVRRNKCGCDDATAVEVAREDVGLLDIH